MSEYKKHIEAYSTHSEQYFSNLVSESEWGDRGLAEEYLRKYWLPVDEYQLKWRKIQNQIFVPDKWLPDLVFQDHYEMLPFRGGSLFDEDNFTKLQECFLSVGDRQFVIIENTFGGKRDAEEPTFRMKYPSDITWAELASGNFISAMILDFFNKEFFVFGETPGWGKHSSSSTMWPLCIVGFQSKYAHIFRKALIVSDAERQEILTWLPQAYRDVIDSGSEP